MKNKAKLKNGIKVISFLLIFSLLLCGFQQIVQAKWLKHSSTYMANEYYDSDKNDYDVCIIGSSQTSCGILPMQWYEDYGISGFNASFSAQNLRSSYFWLREVDKKNDLKLAVLDVSQLFEEPYEAAYRKAIDPMRLSRNKIDAIIDHEKTYTCEDKDTVDSYFFPFLKYHSRVNELTELDFNFFDMDTGFRYYRGAWISYMVRQDLVLEDYIIDHQAEETVSPVALQLDGLDKIVDYCRANGIELMLIKTPKADWTLSKSHFAQDYAEKHDLVYLDFNYQSLWDAVGFDIKNDFKDMTHVNIRGAVKMTDYLGSYISANYALKDFSGQDEDDLAQYNIDVENAYLHTAYDIGEYFSLLSNDRYDVILDAQGDIRSLVQSEALNSRLASLGVSGEGLEAADGRYYFVKQKGKVVAEQRTREEKTAGQFSDGTKYKLIKEDAKDFIKIDGQNLEFEHWGLNVIVYDHTLHSVADRSTLYFDGSGSVQIFHQIDYDQSDD